MSRTDAQAAGKPAPQSALAARWASMADGERRWLTFGAVVVALAVLWWVALAPALAILRAAPARHAGLDQQLQRMQVLQSQAQGLQNQPKLRFDEALAALDASVKQRLGAAATVAVVGERVTVTLKGVPADALAQWLVQVRVNARATLSDARLAVSDARASRGDGRPVPGPSGGAVVGATSAVSPSVGATWDGSVVLVLPPR